MLVEPDFARTQAVPRGSDSESLARHMILRWITAIPLVGTLLRVSWALFWDRRVSPFLKLLPLAAVAYLFLPFDLLRDTRFGLGQLDDVIVIGVLLLLFVLWSPKEIVREHLGTGRHKPGRDVKTVDGKFRYTDSE